MYLMFYVIINIITMSVCVALFPLLGILIIAVACGQSDMFKKHF